MADLSPFSAGPDPENKGAKDGTMAATPRNVFDIFGRHCTKLQTAGLVRCQRSDTVSGDRTTDPTRLGSWRPRAVVPVASAA